MQDVNLSTDPNVCPNCGWCLQSCMCDVGEWTGDDWDEYEPDEHEEAMNNCHGFFETQSPSAVFVCGAAGSEDCDECPFYDWLGRTNAEIEEEELEDLDE